MKTLETLQWQPILINLIFIFKSVHLAEDKDESTADHGDRRIGNLTTSSGSPVPWTDAYTVFKGTSNTRLILNDFFMESMTHLAAERIPERVVHGKGTGAFGVFTVNKDLSDVCKADVFSKVGKKTPVTVRFSTTFHRPGAADTVRDTRGFAVKFYTKEGNYDFVGVNNEMFAIKDPLFFSSFAHAFHANPKTLAFDSNSRWDFLTSRPESLNMFMRVFGDRGIPDGYRHMPGYGIHTFELINHKGKRSYARFRLLPNLGIRNLTTTRAKQLQAEDINYANNDLYNAIANKNFPTWTLGVQIISEANAKKQILDIYDVSKFWPETWYPFRTIGILELNKNPSDQFADIEQLAFNPGNLVPGIRGIDTLFEARVLTYRAAHMYRLTINFNKIRVNCPYRAVTRTYNRDGSPPVAHNDAEIPNYYPNSFNGPRPYNDTSPPIPLVFKDPSFNNFHQPGNIYLRMTEEERCRLVENIVESLGAAEKFLQEKAVELYRWILDELGDRIENRLKDYKRNKIRLCE